MDAFGQNSFGHPSPIQSEVGIKHKWARQTIKKLDKPVLMTVGEDVGLNEIGLMNAMTLVGRFGGCKYNSEGLNLWFVDSWKDIISQMPAVYLLPRGWIAFKFFSEEDAAMVLAGVWRWDKIGLLIKWWTTLFDTRIERYDQVPIWVKLLNLPFEFWSIDFFKLVGNTLGTHLETDLSFLKSELVVWVGFWCCLIFRMVFLLI